MPRNPEPELITVTKDGLRMKYLNVRNSEIPITKAIKIFKEYMKSFHIFCDARLKCKQWLKVIGIGEYFANAFLKQKIGSCKGGSELLNYHLALQISTVFKAKLKAAVICNYHV